MFIVNVANTSGGHGDHTDIVGAYEDFADALARAMEPWSQRKTMTSIDHCVYISRARVNDNREAEIVFVRRYKAYIDGVPQGTGAGFKEEPEWYDDELERQYASRLALWV